MKLFRNTVENAVLTLKTVSLGRKTEAEIQEFFPLFTCRKANSPKLSHLIPVTPASLKDGEIYSQDLAEGYHFKTIRGKIGTGKEYFAKVSDRIDNCQLPRSLPWMANYANGSNVGSTLITHVQFFNLPVWTQNPCRIVDKKRDEDFTQLTYSTIEGHISTGEESYIVNYDSKSNNVFLQIYTCSKLNSLTAYLMVPLIRELQVKFLSENFQAFIQSKK